MYTTNLRKVGDSTMMAIPPALLDLLNLRAGAQVRISVADGSLVVEPHPRPRYTMAELLTLQPVLQGSVFRLSLPSPAAAPPVSSS